MSDNFTVICDVLITILVQLRKNEKENAQEIRIEWWADVVGEEERN